MAFVGIYNNDIKTARRDKVAQAIARYVEVTGTRPTVCLTSRDDAEAMAAVPPGPDIDVRGVTYIPPHTFYVGENDDPLAETESLAI